MYIIKLETSCNATEKSRIVVSFIFLTFKSAKVEVLSDSGREFHNLTAKYEKECRP